jgi:hypothetical protein
LFDLIKDGAEVIVAVPLNVDKLLLLFDVVTVGAIAVVGFVLVLFVKTETADCCEVIAEVLGCCCVTAFVDGVVI